MNTEKIYPVNFSHIGITVPDLEKAVDFYIQVMGWYHVSGPIEVKEKDQESRLSLISRNLYGKDWGSFRFAHLANAAGVGFEIFEFENNKTTRSINDSFKTGITHLAVQDPNIEVLMARIVKYGGQQKSDLMELAPGEKPFKMVYMEDPFGNPIEIYTHSYIQQNSF